MAPADCLTHVKSPHPQERKGAAPLGPRDKYALHVAEWSGARGQGSATFLLLDSAVP